MPVLRGVTLQRVAFASVLLSALAAPGAQAHDVVLQSNPVNGGVVEEFPAEIALEFSGEVQEGFNTIALSRAEGDSVDVLFSGEPEVAGRDVTITVPGDLDPEPGEYKVGFQIVSSDGHSTKGMTTFTYDPATASQGQERPAADTVQGAPARDGEDDEADSPRGWATLVSVLAGFAIAGAAIAAVKRAKRASNTPTTDTTP